MSGSEGVLRDVVAARLREHADRGVSRVNVDVAGEQVTLWLRDGQLRERCTCGGEGCEHVRLAEALMGAGLPGAAIASGTGERPARSQRPSAASDLSRVADALDELSLASARAGFAHPDSPSVQGAIAQLLEVQTEPPPIAVARYVARLTRALAQADVATTARLLDGALRFAEALRRGDDDPEALALQRAWLGERGGGSPASVADLSLLEVAREWLTGLDRAAIERRYLLDLASGEVVTEERLRDAPEGSVGPCPRLLHVAFAECESASRPPRLRLLQYTLTLQITAEHWGRLLTFAQTDIASVRARYLDELRAAPALAEPFVLFAPKALQDGDVVALIDGRGDLLPLTHPHADDGGTTQVLRSLNHAGALACVLGRLIDGDAGVALCPLSALVRHDASHTLRRLT